MTKFVPGSLYRVKGKAIVVVNNSTTGRTERIKNSEIIMFLEKTEEMNGRTAMSLVQYWFLNRNGVKVCWLNWKDEQWWIGLHLERVS